MLSTLAQSFNHKIKTADELAGLLGERPRQKKVILPLENAFHNNPLPFTKQIGKHT